MGVMNELNATAGDVALHELEARSGIPRYVVEWDDPGNDAACEDPPTAAQEIDAWTRRAAASNGFGDVPAGQRQAAAANGFDDSAIGDRTSSYDLRRAGSAHRVSVLGDLIVALARSAVGLLRKAAARYRRHRRAAEIRDLLRGLDDRTLRDLGFHRSEIESVAAEATGASARTRMRTQTFAQC